ncbi:MAG: [protein-PII] uridylyltransferase, partial [Thermodesulfobacteriota bacterium]
GQLSNQKKDFIREFVSGLWDSGFEVGHSVISVSGLDKLSRSDFSVLTTNLTSQFLFGDPGLYNSWQNRFIRETGPRQKKRFLDRLMQYRNSRYLEYGNSIYMLEPNIKEGLGGLRDVHSLRWAGVIYSCSPDFQNMVSQGWLDITEKQWLQEAEDFLWNVRLQLHGIQGRKRDKLVLSAQEEIANSLGFGGGETEAVSAVEGFMRNYYKHSARIRRVTDFVLEKLGTIMGPQRLVSGKSRIAGDFVFQGNHIRFRDPARIKQDPSLLMHIFWRAARHKAHFHHETGQIIRENLQKFDARLREDPDLVQEFFDILLDPEMSFTVLKTMLETGFLEVFLPEFSPIRYKVQYDVYHLYTVDEHLLRTLRELHALQQGESEDESPDNYLNNRELFSRISNKKILYLAALIHDVGKGKGKGHARRGAELVVETGRRLKLSPGEVELLVFLVENHLLLAETALKRDLSEEKPIETCALKVGNVENLSMLYLLTVADSRATGAQVWSSWRKALIRELFIKVRNFLEQEEWQNRDIYYKVREKKDTVHEKLQSEIPANKISSWLDKLSLRYLLNQTAEDIVVHYFLEQELNQSGLKINVKALQDDRWEVVFVCREKQNLFDFISGVLWVNGINILSADIYTRDYEIALDILIVDQLPDPLNPKRVWDRVERDLQALLSGETSLENLQSRYLGRNFLKNKLVVPIKDKVLINEQASDFFTVIEVYTWERPGVLHTISRVLHSFDLTIKSAKITTPGAQVVDVFYVTDHYGGKIMDEQMHSRISNKLLSRLKEV